MPITSLSTTVSLRRIRSLDHFRGYAVLGMILVDFLRAYTHLCPQFLLHANDYCSYADTIMPHFVFAAGFALRLSVCKRLEVGRKAPWVRGARRIAGLALVAIIWYSLRDIRYLVNGYIENPTFTYICLVVKSGLFHTLLHIAATSLWILPAIAASPSIRFGYMIASALIHVAISWAFNFAWVYADPSVEGGPLGFLSWSIPALCGTLAYDVVKMDGPNALARLVAFGIASMLLGWGLSMLTVLYNEPSNQLHSTTQAAQAASSSDPMNASQKTDGNRHNGSAVDPITFQFKSTSPILIRDQSKYAADPVLPMWGRFHTWDYSLAEPPFVPPPDWRIRKWNYWMMSQRVASISYMTFGAGLSLVVYSFFLVVCDGRGYSVRLLETLGSNSLVAYISHEIAGWIVLPYFPRDTTNPLIPFLGYFWIVMLVYSVCRILERRQCYLRV